MVLFEEYVHVLLPLHAGFALLTVALSTHLVVWLGHYCRGRFSKRKATLRFALLSAAAYAITMLLGMALYPTYKVRVRAEYLENPSRIHRDTEQEAKARRLTREQDIEVRRYRSGEKPSADWNTTKDAGENTGIGGSAAQSAPEDTGESDSRAEEVATLADAKVERAARLVRWFDVKEHWAILGLLLAFAVCGILVKWTPNERSKSIANAVRALALGAAGIAWAAALIGLLTAAARSVIAL